MAIESLNPTTGELIEHYDEISPEQIDAKLQGAEQFFNQWRESDFPLRSKRLQAAARILREKQNEFATLITNEMGKPIVEAEAEIEKCAWVCDYYAENAERFLSPRPEQSGADESYVRYDPIGPILAVMPWNFPFWQVFRFAAPALMAGNVGLLKHASNVPGCAMAIERVFLEAGFPRGAFTTLLISAASTDAVIRDRRIRAVTLTGSEAAGRKVAAAAGASLKKTVLELGGSDPFIVLADADIPRAAKAAASSRMLNNGQSCIAAKRFIVEQSVADSFLDAFRLNLSEFKVGNPMDRSTQVGPMARLDLREELHAQVTESVKQGARLELGGFITEGRGAFYPITLLSNVKLNNIVAMQETFGPVAPVIVAGNAETALRIANSSDYGLGGALWTADLDRARDLARRMETGAVFINSFTKSDPHLPFGGVKLSGYGRELSREGIREFMNVKTVCLSK